MSFIDDRPGEALVKSEWTGRYLSDGSAIRVHSETAITYVGDVTQDDWDDVYANMYADWTTLTGDTTHVTNPIDITPP